MGKGSTGFLLISLILISTYIIILILKNKKIIKNLLYKKILNIGLLISFILVAYSGIRSVFWKDFRVSLPELGNHSFWGIIMIYLAIFHTIDGFWFFKSMFKLKKKE